MSRGFEAADTPLGRISSLTTPPIANRASSRLLNYVSDLAMLPERAPSRERLGVGYGSQLDPSGLGMEQEEVRDADEPMRVPPGSVQARLDYAEHNARRRATSMLCLGAAFGFLGFVFAAVLGMYYTYARLGHQLNFVGIPFPSGQDFWPGSVSEMVHDPNHPTGELWRCFEMISAFSIWLSWYPWELRNVYTGGKVQWCWVPFLHLRTFMVPIGMLLVVFVPLPQSSDFGDTFSSAIHYAGASTCLGGYAVFELYTLLFAEFVLMQRNERTLRLVLCMTCGLGLLGFVICGYLDNTSLCCGDIYRVPTAQDVARARANGYPGLALKAQIAMDNEKELLYDTASGTVQVLKYCAYWSEVTAGISMICSLITIWYYAPERLLEMGNEIPWASAEDKDEEDSDDSPGWQG